jgi:hypothetical protein
VTDPSKDRRTCVQKTRGARLGATMEGGRVCIFAWLALASMLSWAQAGGMETTRSQTLQLSAGWNAVFLEVNPSDAEPAIIFTNTPIDIAAAYYAPISSAQFMVNPGAELFKMAGWGVWYAESRPDAFLKSLQVIYGQQPYLLHSKSNYAWTVTGAVVPPEVLWQPGAFNFVGFSVDDSAPPTFAQFFAGSSAHHHNKLYRLSNGAWRRVNDPATETMRSGEAFWVYCDGASKYQGPLRVETTSRAGVVLGASGDDITLRNETDHPITPTLNHLVAGSNAVPIAIVIQALGEEWAPVQSMAVPQPDGAWTQPLPPLEAGNSIRIPLTARLQDMSENQQSSLLKISTDLGTEVWLPVIGIRTDIQSQ